MPHFDLLASLADPRCSQTEMHHALETLERRGIYAAREHRTPEQILAWIDAEFEGTWSSEAAAGGIWIAREGTDPVGFCAFDARGLRFGWAREASARPDAGICGPLAVVPRARGRGIGSVLLQAALFSLRERGYREALLHVPDSPHCRAYFARHLDARPIETEPRRVRAPRTTVLASGDGSNFQAVIDAARAGSLPLDVTALVANRANARVLARAAGAGIASHLVAWERRAEPRDAYDARVLATVAATDPELVLLLGWMHVLPPSFIARFPDILNLHPAFLPLDPLEDRVTMPDGTRIAAFRGARAIDDALALGSHWAGASVHRVGIAIDRGAVLARAPLRLYPEESRERLDERLHELERRVVATALRRFEDETLVS